jgi:hypothetical protein
MIQGKLKFVDGGRPDIARGKSIFTETDTGALIFENGHPARTRLLPDEESDGIGTYIDSSQPQRAFIHHD